MTLPPLLPALSFDHVGIATAADEDFSLLALIGQGGKRVEMPSGLVIERVGPDRRIEIVRPARSGSPIEGFLASRGSALHHIALAVHEPLAQVATRLVAHGYQTTGALEPSSDGRLSLFVHPRSTGGVLIELVEDSRP